MEDLLQVKLTNQERQHLILKSVDKDFRKRLEECEAEYPDAMCFFSHWIVKGEDIHKFNDASTGLNSWFDFHKTSISEFDPRLDFAMLEGERVEAGEWDKTYQCWAKNSYQRVLVLAMNCVCYGLEEDGFLIQSPQVDKDHNPMEFHLKYPKTWKEDGSTYHPCPLGLLDIPLEMLDGYEDCRIQKQLFFGNEFYFHFKNWVLEDEKKHREKKEKRKAYKNSKRNTSSFRKAFKGGFGG